MANLFSGISQFVSDVRTIASYLQDAIGLRDNILADYYNGDHRLPLKVKPGQQNENIVQNWVGLAVDRSVSRLFRGGVRFTLPEGREAQQEYIDELWKLNKQPILLYQAGLYGAIFGTCYIRVQVDALTDPISGKGEVYPRLTAIYPRIIRVKTNPQDLDEVIEYLIEYKTVDESGKETGFREVTAKQEGGTWRIESMIKEGYRAWETVSVVDWQYDFPPIIHWKNLPSLNSCYGDSDIDDVINIQDKSNFVVSNIAKIVKYHAVPPTLFTGVSASAIQAVDSAPDRNLYAIPNPEAKGYAISNNADLASAMAFEQELIKSFFSVVREVDISTFSDKLGALTNYAIRVLSTDALDKNDTKRQLYGDALMELNRRLLVLAGWTGEQSDPGDIQWGEALPLNIMEELQADKQALDMGIVDKQTVAEKYASRYGTDWETIEERLQERRDEQQEIFENTAGGLRSAGGTRQDIRGADGQEPAGAADRPS